MNKNLFSNLIQFPNNFQPIFHIQACRWPLDRSDLCRMWSHGSLGLHPMVCQTSNSRLSSNVGCRSDGIDCQHRHHVVWRSQSQWKTRTSHSRTSGGTVPHKFQWDDGELGLWCRHCDNKSVCCDDTWTLFVNFVHQSRFEGIQTKVIIWLDQGTVSQNNFAQSKHFRTFI